MRLGADLGFGIRGVKNLGKDSLVDSAEVGELGGWNSGGYRNYSHNYCSILMNWMLYNIWLENVGGGGA